MSQIESTAREVFDVASRKGALHVTDAQGSDSLVGFFVPASPMVALGKALVRLEEVVPALPLPSMGAFEVQPYDRAVDKSITITGPEDLTLEVDFDDVNHRVVEGLLPLLVEYLNAIPAGLIQDVTLRAARAEADEEDVS